MGCCKQFHFTAAAVTQLGSVVGDADPTRSTKNRGRPVSNLEVKLAPDGDHEIDVSHHCPAHGSYQAGVIVAHYSFALSGV